jgi:hypothetical protein
MRERQFYGDDRLFWKVKAARDAMQHLRKV